jgi:hypothetical protein
LPAGFFSTFFSAALAGSWAAEKFKPALADAANKQRVKTRRSIRLAIFSWEDSSIDEAMSPWDDALHFTRNAGGV